METRREYAVRLGLAQPGRGRMSRGAHEAIAKAIAEGTQFADTQHSIIVKQKAGVLPKPEKKAKEVVIDSQYTGATRNFLHPKTILVGEVNGHKVEANAIQVCLNSGVSISGCGGCSVSGHRTLTAKWTTGPKRGRIVMHEAVVRVPREV